MLGRGFSGLGGGLGGGLREVATNGGGGFLPKLLGGKGGIGGKRAGGGFKASAIIRLEDVANKAATDTERRGDGRNVAEVSLRPSETSTPPMMYMMLCRKKGNEEDEADGKWVGTTDYRS